MRRVASFCVLTILLGAVTGSILAAEPASGWRGNVTGLWPDSKAPTEWKRIALGAMQGMRSSTTPPAGEGPGEAAPVVKGIVGEWLVLGTFEVQDSVRDFGKDFVGDLAALRPAAGEKLADRTWTAIKAERDDVEVFGEPNLRWLDFGPTFGTKKNQVAYAHAYLFSPRGGPVRIVADHCWGIKAWINGEPILDAPERNIALGSFVGLSRHEFHHEYSPSSAGAGKLRPGWNRLLVKLSSPNKDGYNEMKAAIRLSDPPDVAYETSNIAWMTELPGRSTSTPLIVGDRIILMAEPDQVLCLDRADGKILWQATIDYYEALPPAEKAKKADYAQRVDPLRQELAKTTDRIRRIRLRAEIEKTLLEIDKPKFEIIADGHFEAHYGIVGNTMPTPVSDGEYVYVWTNRGVAACYALDGKRRWITRIETGPLTYGSSPALADGVFAVFSGQVFGLDAATGEERWNQPKVQRNMAAILATRLAGRNVFVSQRGELLAPETGDIIYRRRGAATGDEGWCPPVIIGSRLYMPKYGVSELEVFDFGKLDKDATLPLVPEKITSFSLPVEIHHGPGGKWIDRFSPGSPLIVDGFVYQVDIYENLYIAELATGKMVARQKLPLEGLTHYNAVAVAASPTLIGRNIVILDNQGTALVYTPWPELKLVARNRIETVIERSGPIPAQETLAYAPPVVVGDRIYLRGERYMYCIGK